MTTHKKAPAGAGTPTGATNATAGRACGSTHSITRTEGGEKPKTLFIRSPEVMMLLGVSRSTAQRCIKQVNEQAKSRGLFTIAGACNRALFLEYVGAATE